MFLLIRFTHIQMLVGHHHLAAHGRRLAMVNAVGVSILHIHLGAIAFAKGNRIYTNMH